MTGKRYKSVGANLECPNGMEYMLVKRDDDFCVCQVCSKYTAKEIVDELNNLVDENEKLQETINFIFGQINAFREDCRIYQDFDGASTLTELIRILENGLEI